MKKFIFIIIILSFNLNKANINTKKEYINEQIPTVKDRIKRGNWHNFKEFMLLRCLATAYSKDSKTYSEVAYKDLRSSFGGYINWTTFDVNSDLILKKNEYFIKKALNNQYSAHHDSLGKIPELNALKCIDMYNSKELDDYIKKYIPKNPHINY